MPDPRRRARPADLVGGVLLGAAVGALGTAVHLHMAALPGGGAVPWGVLLALVLAGAAQRWWMRRTAAHGGAAVPAGAAVVVGAFTAVLVLYRMLRDDQLGLPWSSEVAAVAPVALAASIAWTVGLPLLGMALLAWAARRPLPGLPRASSPQGGGGRTSTLGGTPNPVPVRKVDGQS